MAIQDLDQDWQLSVEELDALEPHPDVHALFVHYNNLYFNNKLGACCVEWSSKRMTLCAGQCQFSPDGGCRIRLSEPLLKFRPARDLKDVLLHEMIHAAVLLSGRRDDDPTGHGSAFKAYMHLINSATCPDSQRPPGGYNVTVFHTMLAEVNSYRTHVWRCDRCGSTMRRSSNRRPQEADCRSYSKVKAAAAAEAGRPPGSYCSDERCWFHRHIKYCGGAYIKISEPEKPPAAANTSSTGSSKRSKKQPVAPAGTAPITSFFPKAPSQQQQQQLQATNEAQQLQDIGRPPSPAAEPPKRQQQQQQQKGQQERPGGRDHWSALGSGHRLGGQSAETLFAAQQHQQQQQQQHPTAAASAADVVDLLWSDENKQEEEKAAEAGEGAGRGSGRGRSGGNSNSSGSRSVQDGDNPESGRRAGGAPGGGSGSAEAVLMCPVCCEEWEMGQITNEQLNAHLDGCLARMRA